jgi:hypothetical protein
VLNLLGVYRSCDKGLEDFHWKEQVVSSHQNLLEFPLYSNSPCMMSICLKLYINIHLEHRYPPEGRELECDRQKLGMDSSSRAPTGNAPAPLTPEAAAYCEMVSKKPAYQDVPVEVRKVCH